MSKIQVRVIQGEISVCKNFNKFICTQRSKLECEKRTSVYIYMLLSLFFFPGSFGHTVDQKMYYKYKF